MLSLQNCEWRRLPETDNRTGDVCRTDCHCSLNHSARRLDIQPSLIWSTRLSDHGRTTSYMLITDRTQRICNHRIKQLTPTEVRTIQEMATSHQCTHVPSDTLARLTQRMGWGVASVSSWYRLVWLHRWRRVRHHIHPARPQVGVRNQHG